MLHLLPPPQWTDRCLWKHNLSAKVFAGGNNGQESFHKLEHTAINPSQPFGLLGRRKFEFTIHLEPNTYQCNLDNLWNVQVGSDGRKAFPNQVWFVSFESVHVHHVLFWINSNCSDAQLRACTEDSDCNFTCKIANKINCDIGKCIYLIFISWLSNSVVWSIVGLE